MVEALFWPALLGYGEAALAYASVRTSKAATWGVRLGWLAQTALLAAQAARMDGFPWSSWAGSLNLFGQQGTSTMVGAVSDPADASVPNAALQLIEQSTGTARSLITPATGLFRFVALPPGKYSLRVQADGFKLYELNAIELASSETRDLGRLLNVTAEGQHPLAVVLSCIDSRTPADVIRTKCGFWRISATDAQPT